MKTLQRGFGLPSAIFLLVVLAFLGMTMMTFSTVQQQTAAMDVLGSRAYQAARAGIEWAAYNVAQSTASSPAACATTIPAGSLGGTLAPFAVNVNCAAASYVEGGSTIWVYGVSSVATAGGSPGDQDYVERVISVKLGK